MKFVEDKTAKAIFAQMIGGPAMRIFTAYAGDWQFVISFDPMHNIWAATYQPKHPHGQVSSIQCEAAPEGEKFKQYDTQTQAETACVRRYRQLRRDN